ncbi:MAG: pilE [Proteobacteria bacterium]|nr:pilE [Pseudomonadota bacterium]
MTPRAPGSMTGFTLIELMIVVAIIGILAAIAVPSYSQYVARSKITEAISELASYRVRMEQWFQDNRSYQNAASTGCGAATVSNAKYFSFACTATTSITFTVTATATDASLSGLVYSVDQDNTKTTVSVPDGWVQPSASCWVMGKSGAC